jgi:hypothetical protein
MFRHRYDTELAGRSVLDRVDAAWTGLGRPGP